MANADSATLGFSAFREFVARNFPFKVSDRGLIVEASDSQYLSPVARTVRVERFGWLSLGLALGYFTAPTEGILFIRGHIRDMFLLGQVYAPKRFVSLMSSFLPGTGSPPYAYLPMMDPVLQGKFQAALLASEAFDDPLLVALVEELYNPEISPLDEMIMQFNVGEIYGTLNLDHWTNLTSESAKSSLLLGAMIRLISVLKAFADLFPEISYGFDFAGNPDNARFGQTVGTILSWRLDLADERIRRRFENLNASFLRLVEAARVSNIDQFDWSVELTRLNIGVVIAQWQRLTSVFSEASEAIIKPPSDYQTF